MKRLCEGTYYFQPYHKMGQFAFQLMGAPLGFYPLSYTYRECVEDWCEQTEVEFLQLTEQNGSYRGRGCFEYYRHTL